MPKGSPDKDDFGVSDDDFIALTRSQEPPEPYFTPTLRFIDDYYPFTNKTILEAAKITTQTPKEDTSETPALALQITTEDLEANAETHTSIGEAYLDSNEYLNAITEFNTAIALWPVEVTAWEKKATALFNFCVDHKANRDLEPLKQHAALRVDNKRNDYTKENLAANYKNLLQLLLRTIIPDKVITALNHEDYNNLQNNQKDLWQMVITNLLIKIIATDETQLKIFNDNNLQGVLVKDNLKKIILSNKSFAKESPFTQATALIETTLMDNITSLLTEKQKSVTVVKLAPQLSFFKQSPDLVVPPFKMALFDAMNTPIQQPSPTLKS